MSTGSKPINDGFGHDVDDRVLKEVAQRITDACGPNAVVARFGGDEFVVLLDAIDSAEAHQIGERIITTVSTPITAGEFAGQVQVSVGLATTTDQSATDVVDAADRALLQAKRAVGRWHVDGELTVHPPARRTRHRLRL